MSDFVKDPDAVLDYKFDWANTSNGGRLADWLEANETISSFVITPDSGIVVDSFTTSDGGKSVTVWLSGGTEGVNYNVACSITTTGQRTDERTAIITVKQR